MKQSKNISTKLGRVNVGDSFPVRVMGVINLTRNSFYDKSVKSGKKSIVGTAKRMQAEGADFIDLGARSTAPYRWSEVSEQTETRLLLEAISYLSNEIEIPISVDTARINPARAVFKVGVTILNDPYGLVHPQGRELAKLVSEHEGSIVITAHEEIIQSLHNPIQRISNALHDSIDLATKNGVPVNKIVIDPGFGFFKDTRLSNVEWNLNTLANLEQLRIFEKPILVGLSRKSFLGILGGDIPAEDRLPGSLAAASVAVLHGAHIVRTHDVKETKQAIIVASRIRNLNQKGLRLKSRVQAP